MVDFLPQWSTTPTCIDSWTFRENNKSHLPSKMIKCSIFQKQRKGCYLPSENSPEMSPLQWEMIKKYEVMR